MPRVPGSLIFPVSLHFGGPKCQIGQETACIHGEDQMLYSTG